MLFVMFMNSTLLVPTLGHCNTTAYKDTIVFTYGYDGQLSTYFWPYSVFHIGFTNISLVAFTTDICCEFIEEGSDVLCML